MKVESTEERTTVRNGLRLIVKHIKTLGNSTPFSTGFALAKEGSHVKLGGVKLNRLRPRSPGARETFKLFRN